MREWMPGQQGWTNPEPEGVPAERLRHAWPRAAEARVFEARPYTDRCGPIKVWKEGGVPVTKPALTDREVDAVVRAGQQEPRRLRLEEAQRATRNRRAYARELRPYGRESTGYNDWTGGHDDDA